MTNIRRSILHAATLAARNLRDTAERLERAVEREDFEALAEITLSYSLWPVEQIRGAALALVRIGQDAGKER